MKFSRKAAYLYVQLALPKTMGLSGLDERLGVQSRASRVCRSCSSTGWWNRLLPRLYCVARQLLEHNLGLSDEVWWQEKFSGNKLMGLCCCIFRVGVYSFILFSAFYNSLSFSLKFTQLFCLCLVSAEFPPEQNLSWTPAPCMANSKAGDTGHENYGLISLVWSQRDKLVLIYYEAIIWANDRVFLLKF